MVKVDLVEVLKRLSFSAIAELFDFRQYHHNREDDEIQYRRGGWRFSYSMDEGTWWIDRYSPKRSRIADGSNITAGFARIMAQLASDQGWIPEVK